MGSVQTLEEATELRARSVAFILRAEALGPDGRLLVDPEGIEALRGALRAGRASAALARLADLGVRLPTLQDGQRRVAAALGVPNVMPATVVLRADGSVAKILPQAFTSADEIAAAVENALR